MKSVGGSPTNVAVGAARLGLRVAAVTAVGDDALGHYVGAGVNDVDVVASTSEHGVGASAAKVIAPRV